MVRGLQEAANQAYSARRQARGVQVYSPTRQLRRPGQLANAGTAQSIIQGQQPDTMTTPRLRFPGVPGSLPGLNYTPPNQQPLPVPGQGAPPGTGSFLEQMALQGQQQQQEEPGGFGGFLGTVVNSMPGRMVMGALDVLDRPRRAVISTVQEVADAINGGDASFNDWVDQFNDPAFGFGSVVGSTGNIWADRFIGFAGDVLLDPLTYVGGSSAISGTGRSARVGAATRAISHGIETEIAEDLGKFGYSAINRSQRALLREVAQDTILDPGYYFKVPFGPRRMIPGTGRLEQGVARTMAGARAAFNEGKVGSMFRYIASRGGLEDAMTKVVTGRGPMDFTVAAETIRFHNASKRAGPAAVARLEALGRRMLDEHGVDTMQDAFRQAQIDGTGLFADWTNAALKIMSDYGLEPPRGPRGNYAPFVYTQGGREWFNGPDGLARAMKSYFYKDIDLNEVPTHLLPRTMVPKLDDAGNPVPYKFNVGGKEYTFNITKGTIDEWNAEFARNVPDAGFKLLDDNVTSVMAAYSKSLEDGIGSIAGLHSLLSSKSRLVRAGDDSEVTKEVANEVLTKLANAAKKKQLRVQLKLASQTVKSLRDDVMKQISSTEGILGVHMRKALEEVTTLTARRKAQLDQLFQEDQKLSKQRGISSLDGKVAGTSEGTLERELKKDLDELDKRFDAIHAELLRVRHRAAVEMPIWEEAKDHAKKMGEIAVIPERLKALKRWQDLYLEAAALSMDRETIATLHSRVATNRARIAIVDDRIRDNAWLHATAQRRLKWDDPANPVFPDPRSVAEHRVRTDAIYDPDTGELLQPPTMLREAGVEPAPTTGATTLTERERFQRTRLGVFGGRRASPLVQNWQLHIDAKITELYRAEKDLAFLANASAPQISAAKQAFEQMRRRETEMETIIGQMRGRPYQRTRRMAMQDQLDALRSPTGDLALARNAYTELQKPLKQAEERVAHVKRQLDQLRERQTQAYLAEARRVPPGSLRLPLDAETEAAARTQAVRAEGRLRAFDESEAGQALARGQHEIDQIDLHLEGNERITVPNPAYVGGEEREAIVARLNELRGYETGRFRGPQADQFRAEAEQLRNRLRAEPTLMEMPVGQRIRDLAERPGSAFKVNRRGGVDWRNDNLKRIEALLERRPTRTGAALTRIDNELRRLNYTPERWDNLLAQREELVGLLARREGLRTRRAQLVRDLRKQAGRRRDLLGQVERRSAPLAAQERARNQIRRRLAETTPEFEGRTRGQLLDIQQREDDAVAKAMDNMLAAGVKVRWEPVSPLSPPDPLPFSYHERRILDWAYDQIQNYEHGVTDAGRTATAGEQRHLLDELERVLRPVSDEEREAAELALSDTQRIIDEIAFARKPMQQPAKGTKLHDILVKRVHEAGEKGGATDIASRAHAAVDAATKIDKYHADYLIQNNAVFPGDIRDMRTMVADLNTKLDQYALSPQPNVRQQIEQLTSDVSRYAGFLNTYRHVLQTEQITASEPLAAFILSRELLKERNVLSDQIRRMEKLASNDFERGIARDHAAILAKLRQEINEHSAIIDQQRKAALEGLDYDEDLVKRETGARSRKRARLEKLETEGPPELGAMTEEIDTIVDLVSRYFIDLDNATSVYNDARHVDWNAGQSRRKLEEIEGYMPMLHAQTEQMRYAHESLLAGIDEAKVHGGMVRYRPWTKGEPIDVSVEEAERLLATGTAVGPNASGLPPQYFKELEKRTRAAQAKIERAGGWRTGAGHKPVTYKIRMPDIREGRARKIRFEELSYEEMEQMLPSLELSLEEAETVLPEYPAEVQQQLRRRLEDFKKRQDRTRSIIDKTRVTLPTSSVGDEIEIPLSVAEELAYKNRNVVTNMENSLRNMEIQRSVLLETAPAELAEIRQLINDFTKKPNIKKLQQGKDEIINRANVGGRELTAAEKAQVDMFDKRMDWRSRVARGDISPDEIAELMDRRDRLDKAIKDYRALGDDRNLITSIVDNGNQLFDDLVNGRRDITHEDLELMKELLGGEGGPHAATWIKTINDALRPGGTRQFGTGEVDEFGVEKIRISSEALEAMFREIATIHGDTNIGNAIADRLLGLAADGEVTEKMALEVRNEIKNALVAAAQTERTERIRDVGDIVDLLGFDFFMTNAEGNATRVFPTLAEKMSYLGYTQSRQTFNIDKLRLRIIEQLERAGYDPKRGLEQRLNELYMRRSRLDTMRRGLGIHTRLTHPEDPENFYRFLHQNLLLNEADDLTRIVAAAPELMREGLELQTLRMSSSAAAKLRQQVGAMAGTKAAILDLSNEPGWERARLAVNERLRNAIAAEDEEAILQAQELLHALRRVQPGQVGLGRKEQVDALWQRIADRVEEDNPVFMAEDARLFNRLVVPREMEDAWQSTGAGLRDDLARATEAGDDAEVERLTQMINDHELGAPVTLLDEVPDETILPSPTPEGPGTSEPPPVKPKSKLAKPAIFPIDQKHMAPAPPAGGYFDGQKLRLADPLEPIPTFTDGRRTLYATPSPRKGGWTIRMMELDPNTKRAASVHLQGHEYTTAEEATEAIANLRPGEIWLVGEPPPPAVQAALTGEAPAVEVPPPAAAAPPAAALPPPTTAPGWTGPTPTPPPPTVDERIAAAQGGPAPLPPGEETMRPAYDQVTEQREAAVQRGNAAKARADAIRSQLAKLEDTARIPNGPQVADPLGELNLMVGEHSGRAPMGTYIQADIERTRIRVTELRMNPNRTAEETAEMKELMSQLINMMENHWHAEPQQFVERAEALGSQWDEVVEGGADSAQTPTEHAAEQARLVDELRKAEAEMAAAQKELDGLQQPQMGDKMPESAAPSPITDAHSSAVDEGVSPEPGAPDEIPPQQNELRGDHQLTDEDLSQEHELITREFKNLWDKYGGYQSAPEQVQTQMGMLAARAKQLDRLQRIKVSPRLRNTPDWQRYQMLTRPWVADIAMDWRNVLKDGSASVAVTRQLLNLDPTNMKTGGRLTGAAEDRLAQVLQGTSGARSGLSGPMFRGGLAVKETAARLRFEPMENLRADLMNVRAQAHAQVAEDLAAIGTAEEKIAATEARFAAESQALNDTFLTPPPEISDVGERAQAVADAYHQAQRKARTDLINVNLEKSKREADYTAQLKQVDMQLADVRTRITTMSTDLADLERRRVTLERAVKGAPKSKDLGAHIMDLRQVNSWWKQAALMGGDPDELKQIATVETLLDSAARAQIDLDKADLSYETIKSRLAAIAADPGGFEPVMTRMIVDGWKPVAAQLLKMDDGQPAVIAASALADAITRVQQAWTRPEPWKLVDKYTAFFKTYATARPGFHVRNAISAVFMNLVDNVRLGEIASAPGTWREFLKDPTVFWEKAAGNVLNANTGATMADALNVVFGSGAGGQWLEFGVGTATGPGSRAYQRLMNNKITRWNKRWGSAVEGTARLAMAVDGLRKGMLPEAVLDRVEKFHFNYNDVSALDRSAKRLIPFWTFMSRNLPLQIEQMWLRPRMYLQYQSFVRNFSEEHSPFTPEYWLAQGAFTMDPNAAEAKGEDAPWYLAPDLPHLRIGEDVSALASGDLGKAVLSGINPLFLAPAEAYGFGKKVYTGAPIDQEYVEPQGAMKALTPLLKMLGQTETTGSGGEAIDARLAHVLRSTLPPVDLLERLAANEGIREGRQDETFMRQFLGLPVYQETPQIRQSTRRTQYYNRLDASERRQQLARM